MNNNITVDFLNNKPILFMVELNTNKQQITITRIKINNINVILDGLYRIEYTSIHTPMTYHLCDIIKMEEINNNTQIIKVFEIENYYAKYITNDKAHINNIIKEYLLQDILKNKHNKKRRIKLINIFQYVKQSLSRFNNFTYLRYELP